MTICFSCYDSSSVTKVSGLLYVSDPQTHDGIHVILIYLAFASSCGSYRFCKYMSTTPYTFRDRAPCVLETEIVAFSHTVVG